VQLLAAFSGLAMLVSGFLVWPVAAQSYPDRPVKIMVGFGAGGATDIVTRILAEALRAALGQPFVVENKPGAAGRIANEVTVGSPPDGYTLVMATAGMHLQIARGEPLPFDAQKDLIPIILVAENPHVLVVHPSLPATSIAELIALLKASPGMPYASSGAYTSLHIAAELFKVQAGVDILHVPYRGGGPAVADVIGGQVAKMMFNDVQVVRPFIEGGKLRPLAVTGAKRSPVLAQVPAMTELGFLDVATLSWFGLMAPRGTPRAVIDKLNAAADEILKRDDVRKKFDELGITAVGGAQQEFSAFLQADLERWRRAVALTGTKLE
jgi:tripartite-type tricarboxylate transporter receptor subunit TctC